MTNRQKSAPGQASKHDTRGAGNEADNSATNKQIHHLHRQVNPRKLRRAVIKEEYVAITGNCCAAVILNQMIYWSERVSDFDRFIEEEHKRQQQTADPGTPPEKTGGWIYKTAADLNAETMMGMSDNSILKYLKQLISLGFLAVRRNPKYKWDQTKQYRVDLIAVQAALQERGYPLGGYGFATPIAKSEIGVAKSEIHNRKNCGAIPKITIETTTDDIHPSDVSPLSPPTGETCYPPATTDADATVMANQVMAAQHTRLIGPDRDRYRRALAVKAKNGKLEIPAAEQGAMQAATARTSTMARQTQEQEDADHLRAQQADAVAAFDRLPKPIQKKWTQTVFDRLSTCAGRYMRQMPHLIRRQAAMLAAAK